ncbi:hypothetical protein Pfo_004286 [Paulownia fortunei]|nr:hypothetical protein Pfo_004286 [Paulownia fortunei]
MSEKSGVVNVSSGVSGAASGESNKGVSGGMVDGLESKTLMENPSDKGVLGDGVRVSEESKVLDGESNSETVISGSGWKLVESGSLEINDKHDASKNRVVEMMSRNNGWESWGVMDLVGRVLDGKFCMDQEVEDVNNSEDGCELNPVADMSAWQGVIGEPTSENRIDIKRTAIDKDSDKLDLGYPGEGTGLNANQDLVANGLVPDGKLETEEVNNVKPDVRIPVVRGEQEVNNVKADLLIRKARGEHYITDKEGEYYVSDLVWGKVRSHPWWPGQIFAPSAASDKAKKYFKRESYLIAYFGDQTFAWNEGSKIKPFQMNFCQMEKQSNTDGFCHAVHCALDEVARRVELGLSCPCLPQRVHDKIKFQVVANAGIREESSRRAGGDNLSTAASFLPGELVQFLESLAECPKSKTDRLKFTIAKAQLLAFNRWKGHYELPVLEECGGLLEDDTQFTVKGAGKDSLEVTGGLLPGPVSEGAYDFPSKKRKSTARDGSSRKPKHLSGDEECPKIKEKFISALMSSSSSSLQNDDEKSVKKTGRRPISSGRNRETINSIPSNSKVKRQKILLSTSPSGDVASQSKTYLRVGERICRAVESGEKSSIATLRSGGTLASDGAGKSRRVEMITAEIPTPDVILSKLILAAKNPMQGHDVMISVVDLLRELRNSICLEKSSSGNAEMDAGKHKGKQPSNLETTESFGLEGIEDSYWTDRIIQSYSQDQVLFEPGAPNERAAQLEANIGVVLNLDNNKERDAVVEDLDTENPSVLMNEVSEEYRPTALILNFTNLESIPSIMNLNEIFSRYGPLNESETEVFSKSKRAKVIFKRRADAETAFSSTGKYSIFGPSLVSYRLHYAPTPRKSRETSKRNEKTQL